MTRKTLNREELEKLAWRGRLYRVEIITRKRTSTYYAEARGFMPALILVSAEYAPKKLLAAYNSLVNRIRPEQVEKEFFSGVRMTASVLSA